MRNNKLLTCLIASMLTSNANIAFSAEKNQSLEDRVKYLENRLSNYENGDNFPSFSDMGQRFDDMFRVFSQQMEIFDRNFKEYNNKLSVNNLGDKIEVVGNFPEYNKDEISIRASDNFLIISAMKRQEKNKDNKFYSSKYNNFYQTIKLPYNAETDKIKTEYKDKKLKVIIPLDVKKEKIREIKIK